MTVLCSENIEAGSFYKVKQLELGLKLWTKGIYVCGVDMREGGSRGQVEKKVKTEEIIGKWLHEKRLWGGKNQGVKWKFNVAEAYQRSWGRSFLCLDT